jgi:hypothetical protein
MDLMLGLAVTLECSLLRITLSLTISAVELTVLLGKALLGSVAVTLEEEVTLGENVTLGEEVSLC